MKQRLTDLARAIAREQQEDGSFISLSVREGGAFDDKAKRYITSFVTSTIALAVAGIEDDELERVRQKAADWLLGQAGPQWSFNYWARESAEAKQTPYPDDWDDTSCALAAITRIRPGAITGEVMAHVVTLLTGTESQEGGPYWTWIVGADADSPWRDVDIAVNSNIAYFLSLHEVVLPNLESLADETIVGEGLTSPYYPSPYPIVYFLSRWYAGGLRAKLAKLLGKPEDPLQTAMAVTTAINLGADPEQVAKMVVGLRRADIAKLTRPYAYCYDPAIKGRAYVAGAGALTAALCLEALHKYDEAVKAIPTSSSDDLARRIHDRVLNRAMQRFETMPPEIRRAAEKVRERVLKDDPAGQITLLPYLFRQSLGKAGRGVSEERLVKLGTVSLYGWLAYTIYDDFLDDDGEPAMLPLANVALRELVLALERDVAGPGFARLAWQTIDRMEAANTWEVNNCRFKNQKELPTITPPDYGDLSALADRSVGHSLGCVALVMELGYGSDSPEVGAVEKFFRHFLIARQLNDEAHDWKADLQNGHINAVGAMLLLAVHKRKRSVSGLYVQLEQYFWEHAITQVCDRIFEELAAARQALAECKLIEEKGPLEAILKPIETAARKAAEQQRRTLEFLKTYNPENPL